MFDDLNEEENGCFDIFSIYYEEPMKQEPSYEVTKQPISLFAKVMFSLLKLLRIK